jgi:FkbM family methyltransferase
MSSPFFVPWRRLGSVINCAMPVNKILLHLAKSRVLKSIFSKAMPRVAYVQFPSGEHLAIDTHDIRGPSFHMAQGWKNPDVSFNSYEPAQRAAVESFLREKSKDGAGLYFLDVGANIGIFTLSAKRALPALSIAAFEPHPISALCLRETVRKNNFRGILVERLALADSTCKMGLHLDESDSGGHSLLASNLWNNRKVTTTMKVFVDKLDHWVAEHKIPSVDFIKMDVQGGEDAALLGGLKTLEKFRPGLLVEVQHEAVVEDDSVIATLRKLPFKYKVRCMDGQTGTYEDLKEWSAREFKKGVLFADYLFFPE